MLGKIYTPFLKKTSSLIFAWNKIGKIYKSQKPCRVKSIIHLNYLHPWLMMIKIFIIHIIFTVSTPNFHSAEVQPRPDILRTSSCCFSPEETDWERVAGGGVWVRPRDEELRELGLQSPADLPGHVLLPAVHEHHAVPLHLLPVRRAGAITGTAGVCPGQHWQDQQTKEQHADWADGAAVACLCSLSSQNCQASVSALTFIFPAQTERTAGLQGPRECPEFKGQINIKDIATTFSRTQHIEIFLLFWLKLSIYISKHLRLYSKTFIDSCFIYLGQFLKNSKKTSFKANVTVIHPCKFAKQ